VSTPFLLPHIGPTPHFAKVQSQPERRLTLLYDKVCRLDILEEAWRRVKSNGGAAGVDRVSIDEVREYGTE